LVILIGVLLWVATGGAEPLQPTEEVLPLAWQELLNETQAAAPGERIAAISARFLTTPYRANTLTGGPDTPEQLVINFDGVDCFTLLDYVEALRRSKNLPEFPDRLVDVRYFDSTVSWEQRRHFFTDWLEATPMWVDDVTAEVGGAQAQRVVKQLNRDKEGALLLTGIPVRQRTIHYLPTSALDKTHFDNLRNGDYLGIYSQRAGLDVSHTGILIRRDGQLFLRHASSRTGLKQVVDSPLLEYLDGKPGLVILRAKSR
jgi:hypothetical protein